MVSRQRRMVRLAALLLAPERTTRAVILCILAYAVVRVPVLSGLRFGEGLFMDSTEAYAWGQQFLGGYGRHPPLTGWIAGLWYRVFPAANWSSYALSSVMGAISLTAIYFIARRALDARRAAFIVFVMLLYPLFHIRANRFSNYQVLLALVPLLVLTFLIAFEKRTLLSGAILGLVAGAAVLTMYSGLLALAAIGLAALLHPERGRFFGSPAPYAAGLVFLLALSPHLLWLQQQDFASLRYAFHRVGGGGRMLEPLRFLLRHAAFLAIPLAGAAIALWPWRTRPAPAEHRGADRRLLFVIALVLMGLAPLLAILFQLLLKPDWGNPLFFLAPVILLLAAPRILITRRAVVKAALIAAAWLVFLAAAAVASPWLKTGVLGLTPRYWAYAELARQATGLWRERFNTPLPIVVGELAIASAVTFYSPDHPRMLVDFNPVFSPWIDFPRELERKGFVGVCPEQHATCLRYLDDLAPEAERVTLTLTGPEGGFEPATVRYQVRIRGPAAR